MRGFECLVYTSTVSDQFSYDDLARILLSANRNNPKLDVTGALVFYEGCFMQYLEGPASALDILMIGIQLDPCHERVNIRHRGPLQTRRFEKWAMLQIDDALLYNYEVEHDVIALELGKLPSDNCLEFFVQVAA